MRQVDNFSSLPCRNIQLDLKWGIAFILLVVNWPLPKKFSIPRSMTSSQAAQEEIQKEKEKKTDIWSNFRKWVGPITFQHDIGGNYNYYLCNLRISVSIFFFSEGHISSVFTPSLFLNTFLLPLLFLSFPPRENDRICLFSLHFFFLSPLAFLNHFVQCFLSGKELLILTLSSSDGNNSRASSVHFI